MSGNDVNQIFSFTLVNLFKLIKLNLSNSNVRTIAASAFENAFDFCIQSNRNTVIYLDKNPLNELIRNGKCFGIETPTVSLSKTVITSLKASVLANVSMSSTADMIVDNSTEISTSTTEKTTQNVIYSNTSEIFYEYGIEAGDFFMAKSDDYHVGPLELKVNYSFFNRSYSYLYVHTNGFISFDNPDLLRTSFSPIPLISPFNADIDTLVGGEVFYREVTDDQILFDRLTHEISLALPDAAFKAEWAFVATYV